MARSMSRFQASDQQGVDKGPTQHQPPAFDLQNLIGNQGVLSLLSNNGAGSKQTPDACHHEVKSGETLWGISEQVFGDGMGWSDLYDHKPNKKVIGDDPRRIKPKQMLDICGLDPRNKDLSMEGYLRILKSVEKRFTDPDANGNKKSSLDFVSSMRAHYGYEGGPWEDMIPNAPNLKAPDMETNPELKLLYEANADGTLRKEKNEEGIEKLVRRKVTLPNGDPIDPGHLFTGIDAVQHPDEGGWMKAAGLALKGPGVDNQDGATWSGDVGSAIVNHNIKGQPAGKTTAQSFEDSAGKADLNADLDGVILGHRFDRKKGLTEQLQSYYLDPKNPQGYERRYSQFCDLRGLDVDDDKQLTSGAKGEIKQAVDAFARPFALNKSRKLKRIITHDSESDTTKDMNLYFQKYLEDGLQKESKSTE